MSSFSLKKVCYERSYLRCSEVKHKDSRDCTPGTVSLPWSIPLGELTKKALPILGAAFIFFSLL